MTSRVLLLHGIWNHALWMQPLAVRLRRAGFEPTMFAYDSVLKGPVAALPALLETVQRLGPVHMVGHSLGGVLALHLLRWAPEARVPRVVCLGSPLRGSITAQHMARRPLLQHALGRSRTVLTEGLDAWAGAAEVGVVAGTAPRGVGRWLAPLEGENDGTVLVRETLLPGIRAHCTVPWGHTELVVAPEPAARAVAFLRTGAFD